MKAEHFKSGLAYMLEEFVSKLKSEGKYSKTYRTNIHCFDNYISTNHANKTVLDEEMLEWLEQRDTESASSCRTRTAVVRKFLNYAFLKGWFDKCVLIIPRKEKSQYIPYFFNQVELEEFFKTCDDFVIETYKKVRTFATLLNKIQLPVFFRLLYSCGFRPCELIELKLIDVDEEKGIFYIRKSKNRSERMVVLDDSVVEMLGDYLKVLKTIIKEPELLFPGPKGRQRVDKWQSYYFKKIWNKISEENARVYDFRHNHITINISSWEERSYEFDGRLVYLKKFVGHTNIQQTSEYFQYTPMLIEKLKGEPTKRFKDLCPPPPPTNIEY